jgi:hypothetical protein
MTLEIYTRAMMARFAISEGQRHGGVNNMLAVLHVLRNRVMAGWGDWQEVIETAESRRATIYPPTPINVRTNDVRIILNRVDEIYTRVDQHDLTGGALFYFDQNFPMEEWFKREIAGRHEEHTRVAHIGPVWFFT